jgi:hypothetical protein
MSRWNGGMHEILKRYRKGWTRKGTRRSLNGFCVPEKYLSKARLDTHFEKRKKGAFDHAGFRARSGGEYFKRYSSSARLRAQSK